jgi:hypothetical protein
MFLLLCAAPLFLIGGCSSSQKVFTVISYPPGATIRIDGQSRGVTDMEKLSISFDRKPRAVLLLEKEGYQPAGTVLKMESEPVLFFALQESPMNSKLLQALNEVQRDLQRFLAQVAEMAKKGFSEKNP